VYASLDKPGFRASVTTTTTSPRFFAGRLSTPPLSSRPCCWARPTSVEFAQQEESMIVKCRSARQVHKSTSDKLGQVAPLGALLQAEIDHDPAPRRGWARSPRSRMSREHAFRGHEWPPAPWAFAHGIHHDAPHRRRECRLGQYRSSFLSGGSGT